MKQFKEFDLRERGEIVLLAKESSKTLSAQQLIDYFQYIFYQKENLKDLFIDFFIFHNPDNQKVKKEIGDFFDRWYESSQTVQK